MALFAGITAAIGAAPAIASGFNGALAVVNVSENAEHVEPSSKLVVAPAGVDLTATLALQAIKILGIAPGAAALAAITQAQFDSFSPKWSDTMAQYQLYYLASAGGAWACRMRSSDTMDNNQYVARMGANQNILDNFANATIAYIANNPGAASLMSNHGKYVTLSVIRGCHHRQFTDGHHGFTTDTQNSSKRSNHICSIVGSEKEAYVAWLPQCNRTHDLRHCLTHAAINELADGLVGTVPIAVPAGTVDVGYSSMANLTQAFGARLVVKLL